MRSQILKSIKTLSNWKADVIIDKVDKSPEDALLEALRGSGEAQFYKSLGWTPHKAQGKVLDGKGKVKILCCGRRWGKTELLAKYICYKSLTNEKFNTMIISPTSDQCTIIYREIIDTLQSSPYKLLIDSSKEVPFPELILANGSIIRARTSGDDGRNIRGHGKFHLIVLDEGAFIPDRVIKEVIDPMRLDLDPQMIMASTPFGKSNAFYERYMRGIEDGKEYQSFHYGSRDNPYLKKNVFDELIKDMGEIAYLQEIEAIPQDDSSALFRWEHIIAGAVGSFEEPQKDRCYVAGVDIAKLHDYTVICILDIKDEVKKLVAMDKFRGLDYPQTEDRIISLCQKFGVSRLLLDQTGIGEPVIDHLKKKAKFSIEGMTFTEVSKNDLISGLAVALQNGKIIYPKDEKIINELKYYGYKMTASKHIKLGARGSHNDDIVSALALALKLGSYQKFFIKATYDRECGLGENKSQRDEAHYSFRQELRDRQRDRYLF